MDVVVCIVGDGRSGYLSRCMASIAEHLPESLIEATIIINDHADLDYQGYLNVTYPQVTRIVHHDERRGLAGAVQSAWQAALEYDAEYVFHVEEDFTFTETVPIADMAYTLMTHPHLAQIVLKRNAVNDQEFACGGLVETAPDEYTECSDDNLLWTEHSRIFSLNPFLARRSVIEDTLDLSNGFLESEVTDYLLNAGYRFALWGGKFDPPRCEHIGQDRSAGYRW